MYLFLFGFLLLFLSSCQWGMKKESAAYEQSDSGRLEMISPDLYKELKIDQTLKLVDARSYFAYSTSHLPGAVSLNWQSFKHSKRPAYIRSDLHTLARKMARSGLGLKDKILVLGEGQQGKGEAGQIALALLKMGFKKIDVVKESYIPLPRVFDTKEKRQGVAYWQPVVDSSVEWSKKEVLKLLNKEPGEAKDFVIIDARSSKEYVNAALPNINAYNIEWKEFLKENGRIQPNMRKKLLALGIKSDTSIVVLSNSGRRSASLVFALRKLGFPKSGHFPGGWRELVR